MSAVLDQPLPMTDPTADLELVSGDEVALEATRHVFLAADLLDPARKRDIGMLDGGEEIPSLCMRRTSGRLPRCEITPLEVWVEWMPLELFPQGTEHLALKLKGTQPDAGGRIFPALYGYPYYPAHAIVDVTGISSGQRRGIVELENLRGVPYGKDDREMQRLFFPADYRKPVELRLIAEHIEKVGSSVADPDAKDTANFMLRSCAESREYMEGYISASLTRLAERKSHDYTHKLSAKDRSFMAQLEMKVPTVSQLQDTAEKAVASLPPELLEQMNAQSEALANLGPVLSTAIGQAIKEALAASKPAPTAAKAPKAE